MKKNDRKELIVIMNHLSDEFDGGKPVSEQKIDTWESLIVVEYGMPALKTAVRTLIRSRDKYEKGFPRISEIVRIVDDDDNEDIEDIALHQWITVKETIVKVGTYSSVKFDDPLIHKTINSISGWVELGQVETDQLQWKEKEFIRNYISFARNIDEIDCPKYLPGVHANSYLNQKYGHEIKVSEVKTMHPREVKQIEDKSKNVLKELSSRMKRIK